MSPGHKPPATHQLNGGIVRSSRRVGEENKWQHKYSGEFTGGAVNGILSCLVDYIHSERCGVAVLTSGDDLERGSDL